MAGPGAVLRFWFEEIDPRSWFRKDPAIDALIRERFGRQTCLALEGGLDSWGETPEQGLALILLLDQFPRQIWRNEARAFAGDDRALALSSRAVERGWIAAEPQVDRRRFWLMPLMHQEDLAIQNLALPLFRRFTDERTSAFAERHRDQIARFGRFPQRNAALGRPATAEEEAFLRQPGTRF